MTPNDLQLIIDTFDELSGLDRLAEQMAASMPDHLAFRLEDGAADIREAVLRWAIEVGMGELRKRVKMREAEAADVLRALPRKAS